MNQQLQLPIIFLIHLHIQQEGKQTIDDPEMYVQDPEFVKLRKDNLSI